MASVEYTPNSMPMNIANAKSSSVSVPSSNMKNTGMMDVIEVFNERTIISLTELLAQVFIDMRMFGLAFWLMRWNTTMVS